MHSSRAPCVPSCLLGQLQRNIGDKVFLKPFCVLTNDGFQIGVWFKTAIVTYKDLRVTKGFIL